MLLGMCALLPLLNIIDQLMKFAQGRDVYICDFFEGLHKSNGKIYEFYIAFSNSEFYAFTQLLACNHEHIYLAFPRDKILCILQDHNNQR